VSSWQQTLDALFLSRKAPSQLANVEYVELLRALSCFSAFSSAISQYTESCCCSRFTPLISRVECTTRRLAKLKPSTIAALKPGNSHLPHCARANRRASVAVGKVESVNIPRGQWNVAQFRASIAFGLASKSQTYIPRAKLIRTRPHFPFTTALGLPDRLVLVECKIAQERAPRLRAVKAAVQTHGITAVRNDKV